MDKVKTATTTPPVIIKCNIHDYIEWCQDISVISKREYKKLIKYADSFVDYISYINGFDLKDTPELRKKWFEKTVGKNIMNSLSELY